MGLAGPYACSRHLQTVPDVAARDRNLQAFTVRSGTAAQRIRKRFIQVAQRWKAPFSSVDNTVGADSNHPALDLGV